MRPSGLYRMKPAWQRLLTPLAEWLVARHVSADLLTVLALVAATLAGACLAVSDAIPALLMHMVLDREEQARGGGGGLQAERVAEVAIKVTTAERRIAAVRQAEARLREPVAKRA